MKIKKNNIIYLFKRDAEHVNCIIIKSGYQLYFDDLNDNFDIFFNSCYSIRERKFRIEDYSIPQFKKLKDLIYLNP